MIKEKQTNRTIKSRSGLVTLTRESEKQLKEAAKDPRKSDSPEASAADTLSESTRRMAEYGAKKLSRAIFQASPKEVVSNPVQKESEPSRTKVPPEDSSSSHLFRRFTRSGSGFPVPPSGGTQKVKTKSDPLLSKSTPPPSTKESVLHDAARAKAISDTQRQKAFAITKKAKKDVAESKAKQSYRRLLKSLRESIRSFFVRLLIFLGIAVLLLLVFSGFLSVLYSGFGVFFSNETDTGTKMTDIIQKIDSEYTQGIERQVEQFSSAKGYDQIKVVYRGDGDGDSAAVNNWNDVLSVYAVLYTTDPSNATDVLTVKPDTEVKLSSVFHAMNKVSYDRKVTYVQDTEDPEKTKKILTIYVTQTSKTYKEAAELYGFSKNQTEQMEEMMAPAYFTYFANLVGVDVTGGEDLTSILSNLPPNSKGSKVVEAALTRLGAPYVMGAKGDKKFDCSGLVYWSIFQVDPTLGSTLRTNAAGQAKYCYDRNLCVGESELLPGDLVFWQNLRCEGCHRWKEVHHTGIYIGNGKIIEASSSRGRVVIRDLWTSKNYPLFLFGRPY